MKFVPTDEQETTINISRNSDTALIYTCDSTMITKLDKLVKKDPVHVSVSEPDEYGKKYTLPKSYVKFHTPRILTDEQIEAMARRAKERFSRINPVPEN